MNVIPFVLVGAVGILSLVVFSFTNLRWWSRSICALVLTAVIVGLLSLAAFRGRVFLGNDSWFEQSPIREMILFAFLLFGMMTRVLSLAIEERKGAGEQSSNLKLSRWDFVYPMLFAVPTFGGLLSQVGVQALSLTNIVLSFQTGFFWQTILKRAEPK